MHIIYLEENYHFFLCIFDKPASGSKRSRGVAASRGSSGLAWTDRHVCATPLPRHRWPAGCGARSGQYTKKKKI
ncbi:unnamed protein product [Spirodela intermedia]|uniref:Ribosomal protein L2 n=1 Tax=Spirodela intermedia TaxID=51605 RepID=A0ABN7E9L2_SPIIN|nr:unnamed protein product [Spirodela intermedia]